MTSIFKGQPPKTRPFSNKTRVIWVLGIYPKDPDPSKLAILRTQPPIYKFKPFHWRVKWSLVFFLWGGGGGKIKKTGWWFQPIFSIQTMCINYISKYLVLLRNLLGRNIRLELFATFSSWWLNQPIWKISKSNWKSSPIYGVKIPKIHHQEKLQLLQYNKKKKQISCNGMDVSFKGQLLIARMFKGKNEISREWMIWRKWLLHSICFRELPPKKNTKNLPRASATAVRCHFPSFMTQSCISWCRK